MTVTVSLHLNGVAVPVTLDQAALAEIAAALPVQETGSPWLAGAQAAADYLGWPRERVYKRLPEIPHYKDEGRLMFRKDELDAFLEGCR